MMNMMSSMMGGGNNDNPDENSGENEKSGENENKDEKSDFFISSHDTFLLEKLNSPCPSYSSWHW